MGIYMDTTKEKTKLDILNPPYMRKILIFALPILATGILQQLYNTFDMIVVGRFDSELALAAVGSTASLINLILNIFLGFSVGCTVAVAKYIGSKNQEKVEKVIHTSIFLSLMFGVIVGAFGAIMSKYFLALMGTPSDIIDLATVYLRVYFIGTPFNLLYTYGSGILKGSGDTKRPLIILTSTGLLNVALNLLFVITFGMGVFGVAFSTVISQAISAVAILIILIKEKGYCKVSLKKLRIHGAEFLEILKIGLPAGFQGSMFSISNVIIQSSVNSFGSSVVAGNTSASNLESFSWTAMNCFYQAALTFMGQNFGAKRHENFGKIMRACLIWVILIGLLVGVINRVFAPQLLSLYNDDPQIIAYGMQRMYVIALTHFLCGLSDVLVGLSRGLGYSFVPMMITVFCICVFRVIWIFTVFAVYRTQYMLYISYPISWILSSIFNGIFLLIVKKKVTAKMAKEKQELAELAEKAA